MSEHSDACAEAFIGLLDLESRTISINGVNHTAFRVAPSLETEFVDGGTAEPGDVVYRVSRTALVTQPADSATVIDGSLTRNVRAVTPHSAFWEIATYDPAAN